MRRGRDTVRARDESEGCMFDMLSILMQARSFDVDDYTVGQKIIFPMATGTKIEDQTLIYRGKKVFKAEGGVKYRCLVFSLVEYKKGKEKEVITFYITDDKNHLPVRLDLYLNFGSAKAFLKEIKRKQASVDIDCREEVGREFARPKTVCFVYSGNPCHYRYWKCL